MKFILAVIFSLLLTSSSFSQTSNKLSKADSIKLNTYFDSLNTCRLFSQKRQLYFDTILSMVPNYAYGWQQKAMPLFKQKKYEIGMPFLDSAVKHDKENHWTEYRGFMKCIFQKDYTGAIVDLQNVKKKNEDGFVMDHSYNFYIGLSYLQLNKFDSADLYLKKSISFSEKKWKEANYLEYFYAGIIKMEKDDYENANIYFNMALKIYSKFSDAKYYLAEILSTQKKYKEALAMLNETYLNLKEGYTINEDNAVYEYYPYQINLRYIDWFMKDLQAKIK